MTHDELLAKINKPQMNTIVYEGLESYVEILALMAFRNALRAVVELHKPGGYEYFEKDICEHCTLDIDYYIFYPCPTIEIIEKELL